MRYLHTLMPSDMTTETILGVIKESWFQSLSPLCRLGILEKQRLSPHPVPPHHPKGSPFYRVWSSLVLRTSADINSLIHTRKLRHTAGFWERCVAIREKNRVWNLGILNPEFVL